MTTLGHVYRITPTLNWAGVLTVQNVFHVKVVTAGSDTDSDVLDECAQWLDDCYTWINGVIHVSTNYVDIKGFNVNTDTPLSSVAWPSLVSGGASGGSEPPGVAALLILYTAASKVIGRKFFGPISQSQLSGGLWVAGTLTALLNFGIQLVAGPDTLAGGTVLDFGIYSKSGTFRNVTRFSTNAIPGYQRRRRQGVGI